MPRYSLAMKNPGIAWDERTLHRWLAEPKKVLPGNLMGILGVTELDKCADIIFHLNRLK